MIPTPDVLTEPTITEVEPGLWELSFTHNGHKHGLRAYDGFVTVHELGRDVEEWRTGKQKLEPSARVNHKAILTGKMKCALP